MEDERESTRKRLINVLKNHNVPYYERKGRVYADTMISCKSLFEEVDDLTDYTIEQVLEWLGY